MTSAAAEPTDSEGGALERLIRGYQFTQALFVAVDLLVPDLVAAGVTRLSDLAVRCGAHEASLGRLLRALTTLGVFTEDSPGTFGPTALSDALRDVEGSRRAWLVLHARDLYQTWAELEHSVRTGQTAASVVYGMDSWTYRSHHPEMGARFDAAMTDVSRRRLAAFVEAYPMTGIGCVVDVGGGRGALLAGSLADAPGVKGILFDQPHVVAEAAALLEASGVRDRVEVVPGDVFTGVPAGGDAYVLSAVLHDWDDDRAIVILEQVRAVLRPDARVLLYERVLPTGTTRHWDPYFSDLNMMQGPGGRERTEPEWSDLLAAAGLALRRVIPTSIGFSILEATLAAAPVRAV